MSPHGALRAYTVFPTVEPLRGSPMSHLLQYRYSLHISDVRVGRGLSCHRMAHCVLIRCYLQPSLSEAPRCRTFFSTGTVCTSPTCEWGGGYRVTAWRTSCLYGVTYSRASPRLPDVAPSSVPVQSARLRRARGEVFCHRMAHFVLIRCFTQQYVSDVP